MVFFVDVVKQGTRRRCRVCKENFKRGEFEIYQNREKRSHLDCFQSDYPRKIGIDQDIELGEEVHREIIENWVRTWNQQLWSKRVQPLPVFFRNSVAAVNTDKKRAFLASFSYLTSKELELCVGLVCKEWHSVSREDEVWIGLLERDFREHSYAKPHRSCYIEYSFQTCRYCKQVVTFDHFYMICPLSHKPLCDVCSNCTECVPIPREHMDVFFSNSEVDELDVPVFFLDGDPYFCVCDVKDQLSKRRRQRKQWLIQLLLTDSCSTFPLKDIAALQGLNSDIDFSEPFGTLDEYLTFLKFKDLIHWPPRKEEGKSDFQLFKAKYQKFKREVVKHLL